MLQRSWIDAIFARLLALYGNQFSAKWAGLDIEGVKETWAETLDGLSGEQIKHGLLTIGRSGGQFPPSAPEFYAACKSARIETAHKLYLPPPRKEITEADRERIRKLKLMLTKSNLLNR